MDNYDADLALAKRALAGDNNSAQNILSLRPELIRVLEIRGTSNSKAEEIVADVLGECFGSRKRSSRASTDRILELYRGDSPLVAWLLKACYNRMVDDHRRSRTDPIDDEMSAEASKRADADVVKRVSIALEHAFLKVDPLALIFLRLVYLHGVKQRELAFAWRCHEATVSRLISQGLKTLRDEALAFLRKKSSFVELEWSDLLAICENPPDFLYECEPDARKRV
jgi:RNA polymerase sigma factor (sigma-70 family)